MLASTMAPETNLRFIVKPSLTTSSTTPVTKSSVPKNILFSVMPEPSVTSASREVSPIVSIVTLAKSTEDSPNLNFKSDHLQQLSTSPLPPFSPGSPPRPNSVLEHHSCPDCGDSFTLRSSLTFHTERRSVLIKFYCDACKTHRSFYNRCALKSYIRAHVDKNEPCHIQRASVFPLPRVLMDGLQNEVASALDDETDNREDENAAPPTDLLEFSIKEDTGTLLLGKIKDPAPSQLKSILLPAKAKKIKCLDCNEEFPSLQARKEHLTNGDKIPVVISQCNTCQMICPSKCSLKAHQRMHLQVSPYVCPECGDSPDAFWTNFQHHVNMKCLHNSRGVGYKCPICKRVSPSRESLLKHMELHTEKYLKCDGCPRAYMTVHAFDEHVLEFHSDKSFKYNSIYKCSLCDIVFLNEEQMLSHRSTHLKEQVCEFVFNCMQCGKASESKAMLLDHMKANHPKTFKAAMYSRDLPETKRLLNTYKGKVECMLCNSTFHNYQGYSIHANRAHVHPNEPCLYCHMIISNRREMMIHGKKHLKNGYTVCILCKNKKFKDLENHLMCHVERLRFCSACPICNELLQGMEQALTHLRMEHLLTDAESPQKCSPGPMPNKNCCHFCRVTFDDDFEFLRHMKTKHTSSPAKSTPIVIPEENAPPPAKKQRVEDGNSCAKCDFNSSNRDVFKKHLLTHKTNKSSFQCQECGLCFVVEPALFKHLKIIHKVQDPKKYVEDEGSNFMPDLEKTTEAPASDSLICNVCFTTFSTEVLLKTHMRSHGMAFIQAKKTSATA